VNRLPVPPGSLDAEPVAELTVEFGTEQAHKARVVLRLREGDAVQLFDGRGVWADAVLATVSPDAVKARVTARHVSKGGPALHIAQGLAKGDKLEVVIQKATELGAASVRPFRSVRAVVKLEGEKARERVARWQKIAEEASRQCGRADTLQVAEVADLSALLREPGAKALLYEGEAALRLSEVLDAHALEPLTLIIGPEGGFAPEEVAQAREAGAAIVTLGMRVLRTETVALAALAIALHRRGELG
jgi:16S rRNA (uracil1498-N3)-methyltransferase